MVQVRGEPLGRRLTNSSVQSGPYAPGREAPVCVPSAKHREQYVLLKTSNAGDHGVGPDRPNALHKKHPGRGRPSFYTKMCDPVRSVSEECRERVKEALKTRDIKELREAYKKCFKDDKKKTCLCNIRDVFPLQKMVSKLHNTDLEEAINADDRKLLEKAIKNAETDDTIVYFSDVDGEEPITLMKPAKLQEARNLLEKMIRNAQREEDRNKAPPPGPPKLKKEETPPDSPDEDLDDEAQQDVDASPPAPPKPAPAPAPQPVKKDTPPPKAEAESVEPAEVTAEGAEEASEKVADTADTDAKTKLILPVSKPNTAVSPAASPRASPSPSPLGSPRGEGEETLQEKVERMKREAEEKRAAAAAAKAKISPKNSPKNNQGEAADFFAQPATQDAQDKADAPDDAQDDGNQAENNEEDDQEAENNEEEEDDESLPEELSETAENPPE